MDNFNFGLIDLEGEPPVLGDKQAPGSFAIARELMGLPARYGAQLRLLLHVLEEGDDPAELWNDGSLQARLIVLENEAAQALMDHVPNLHS